jgi:hypothetical protein
VADALVVDALPRPAPEAGPRTPVAMFGHSRAAAATPEIMLHHLRGRAGVMLDRSPAARSSRPAARAKPIPRLKP